MKLHKLVGCTTSLCHALVPLSTIFFEFHFFIGKLVGTYPNSYICVNS